MYKVYKTDSTGTLVKLKEMEKNCWIDLINPSLDEINFVIEKTKIDGDLLIKLLDEEELPRIEIEDDSTLIVVDVPLYENEENPESLMTYPLGILTNKDYLITISLKDCDVLSLFRNSKIKGVFTSKKTRFIIQLLHYISSAYIKYLTKISDEIDKKEQIIYKETSNKELINLTKNQRTLLYFITSLKANNAILEKLSKGTILHLYEEDLDLLEDAIIETKQGVETAVLYREILSSMADMYATIVSNNLNVIMKFLAGITIVLAIPTMISSFMGMNVYFGIISENKYAVLIILGISFIIALIVAAILKRKNML